jgi:hypothetical protein
MPEGLMSGGLKTGGLKIGVEATSLIGHRSGVGHTTKSIIEALVTLDEGVEVTLQECGRADDDGRQYRSADPRPGPAHPK